MESTRPHFHARLATRFATGTGSREQGEASTPRIARREFLVSSIIAAATALAGGRIPMAAATPLAVAQADWQSVLESMFPHPPVDRRFYVLASSALTAAAGKDPGTRQLLASGWQSLEAAAGGSWTGASPAGRTAALGTIVDTPLFVLLRQTMVFTFYASPDVWQTFGYEGDAWRFGGYLGRGVNTIDWLPDPPALKVEREP